MDRVQAIELHGCELFSFQFARHRLKVALQVKDGPTPRARGYDADIVEALLRQSGDLETARGFPVGVERSSKTLGSSQQRRPTRQQWRQAGSRPFVTRTTSPFCESVDFSQAHPDQSVGLGFVAKFGSLEGPAKFG